MSVRGKVVSPHGLMPFMSTHNAMVDMECEIVEIDIAQSDLENVDRKFTFRVPPWETIDTLKQRLLKKLDLGGSSTSNIRILFRGIELPNRRQVNDIDFTPQPGKHDASSSHVHSNIPPHTHLVPTHTHMSGVEGLFLSGVRPLLFYSFRNARGRTHEQVGELRGVGGVNHSNYYDEYSIDMMERVCVSFLRGIKPVPSEEGTGGTYFIRDSSGERMCVFKPRDEEAFAPNNPKLFVGGEGHRALRPWLSSGDGAARELAAYLLDQSWAFYAVVPLTTMVEAFHPAFHNPSTGIIWKEGSLQKYVQALCTVEYFTEQNAVRQFSPDDVHRIGCLDIRLCNVDRNEGNILVVHRDAPLVRVSPWLAEKMRQRGGEKRGERSPHETQYKYRLIPIDHGLCLPEWPEVTDLDLVWYKWPQAKLPFSRESLKRVFQLDFEFDSARLKRKLQMSDPCLRTMKVCTLLLITGAKSHLNLFQIASIICRVDVELPSTLELLVRRSIAKAATSMTYKYRLPLSVDRGGVARGMDLIVYSNKNNKNTHTHTNTSVDKSDVSSSLEKKRHSHTHTHTHTHIFKC
eukprot:GHVR01168056.1.p1 GENE.GHVR01168056.1~~GHVR01168056.1.p1  ORF type:complete len:574 (+),score=161.56 GHVR01168056.1:291-2012(+)